MTKTETLVPTTQEQPNPATRIWISGSVVGSERERDYKAGIARACWMLGFDLYETEEKPAFNTGAGPLMMRELYAVPREGVTVDLSSHPKPCDGRCMCRTLPSAFVPPESDNG